MGTTLTGTKPKDTYDSLIKVEDNGPISGTAKYLSDGLGNNLPIAVSTSNVGIGTSAPTGKLEVAGTSTNTDFRISRTVDNTAYAYITAPGGGTLTSVIGISGTDIFSFDTNKYIRFAAASGGIQFNGDTAAANALDDYEEGTFTPTATSGITINTINNATYTKIGNTVTFQIWIKVDISSADFVIAGLPFAGSGRTTGSMSNTSQKETIANLLINSEIYGYAATTVLDDDLLIGGVYRVA
jgi:hypothetical protein